MYLGLDLGTGSIKAAVVDRAGVLAWSGEASYALSVAGARAEIDPELWWSGCRDAMAGAPQELLAAVEAVGLSGQMHGLVLLGADDAVVRDAILWPDRRATDEAELFAQLEQRQPGALANPALPGMPGPMLLWMRTHEPDLFARIERIVAPKDWLRARLTDERPVVTDASDASATLMYDVMAADWSVEVRELLGLTRAHLPDIVPATSVAGRVGRRAADELRLRHGLPVVAGAGDSAAALLGLGVDEPGCVVLNVGTGGQVMAILEAVRTDVASLGLHEFRTAGTDHPWYVMAPVLNAGLALTWVRTILGLGWDPLFEHARGALAETSTDPLFVPFLVGERDPTIGLDARGAWLHLTAGHDRAALARSALVGVASYLAHRTRKLLELTGADSVIVSGGSTRSTEWAQLITDLIDHDVLVATDGNASVRGAARLAAASQGVRLAPPPVRRLAPRPELARFGTATIDRLLGAGS